MLSREVRDLLANAKGLSPANRARRSPTVHSPAVMAPPAEASASGGPPPTVEDGEEAFETVDVTEADQQKTATKVGIWTFQYDPHDLKLWFSMVEDQMTMLGVTSQYLKRMALAKTLPSDVRKACAPLLRLSWNEAKADDPKPYQKVKALIVETFGPKDEDLVSRMNQAQMTSKPSELGHELVELICKTKLVGCACCARIVHSLWISKLPDNIRSAIAGSPKFNEESYADTFKLADAVWQATRGPNVSVAAVSTDVHQDGEPGEVAAVKGSSNRKGSGQKSSDKDKTRRPPGICRNHLKYGTKTRKCADPSGCALANCIAPPQIHSQQA